MTAQEDLAPKVNSKALLIAGLLAGAALWAYWTTLATLADRWSWDPQYSHGYLVPVFAAYLLWVRYDRRLMQTTSGNILGLFLLGLAVALRLAGAYYYYSYFDQISLVPCVAGLFLLAGSWPAFFWSLPAVGFLVFMVPLPDRVAYAMSGPMQTLATQVSTFTLQVIGMPAIAEGNVILLNEIELGIVEACSGLRMLVVFFALSTAVAMMIKKPLWEKLLIASSAIPIALVSNILRIVVTGLFYDAFGSNFGGAFFHDLAGWLMMPLGLVFLGIELWILKSLLIERPAPLASQVVAQRVEVPAISLYDGGAKPRRKSEPEPAPVEANA